MNGFIENLVSVIPTKRQLNWQKLEFTSFIHYSICAFTDKEWGDGKEDISIFNPKALDTDKWCENLKKAEIKACILTAKHHDGFCLWDTKFTKHYVMYSPYKQDIVSKLSNSCKKYGLKFGIYLSPWDRHEPTYGQGKPYDDYFCNQLTELMSNYGELYTIWFDGACGEGSNGKKQIYDWDRYYALIRELQPNAVISVCGPDVRWCGNEAGNCRPSEWSIVPKRLMDVDKIKENSQQTDDSTFFKEPIKHKDIDLGSRELLVNENELVWYPAEVDTSIREGWFHHDSTDTKVRSLEELKKIYINSVGGNAVLLLNVPPHRDGYFTKYEIERLTELGEFIRNDFKHNLIENADLSATSTQIPYIIENVKFANDDYWKAEDYCEDCKINIDFKSNTLINYLVLQEQIMLSQRIENFEIYVEIDGKYQNIYKGTVIGYKKICKFKSISTQKLVIHFKSSRKCPTLKFIGVY